LFYDIYLSNSSCSTKSKRCPPKSGGYLYGIFIV